MAYRVEYGSVNKVRNTKKCRSHAAELTGLCLLIFFFLVSQFWPRGIEVLKTALIPENAAVAASAMEEMAQDLQEGVSLFPALKDFFQRTFDS